MAAIGIMIMIKNLQAKWPSLMQAIYKASPVILEIRIALYHPTEWLILSLPTEFIAGSDHELSGYDLSWEKGEKLDPAGAEVHYLVGASWCLMHM